MDELRLLASLSHPNLIQFHGGFVEGESLCVVVDLLPSGDLGGVIRQHLAFGRHIPEEQVWTYLLQLAAGLRHLHRFEGPGRGRRVQTWRVRHQAPPTTGMPCLHLFQTRNTLPPLAVQPLCDPPRHRAPMFSFHMRPLPLPCRAATL
ncbi:hypothetical protein ABPG75_006694 [Micractinium tetrahymenae]